MSKPTPPSSHALERKLQEAMQHHRRGELDRADQLYRGVLVQQPGNVPALHMLGILCFQKGLAADAAKYLSAAVDQQPGNPILHCNLGTALEKLGRLDDALGCQDKALSLVADYAEALHNRANVLLLLQRPQEALASADRAIRLRPDMAEAHFVRANAMAAIGQLGEAVHGYDTTLRHRPNFPEALSNRGATLLKLSRVAEALASFEKALAINPRYPDALLNYGNALRELKRSREAIDCFDRVLAINPDVAEAWNNRGNALADLKRLPEARDCYRRAIELRPSYTHALVQYFINSRQICAWQGLDDLEQDLLARLERGDFDGPPFAILSLCDDPRLQRTAAEAFVRSNTANLASTPPVPPRPSARGGTDRIRLGYMSSDFGEHPIAYLVAELIELHDRSRFDVIGLSTGQKDDSGMRQRMTRAFDKWIDASGQPDAVLQATIRQAGIDILIDLGGHTKASRHFALAGRPAPVQVSYLGYIGASGAPYLDYVIADRYAVPEAEAQNFGEQLVYLPDTFQVSDRRRAVAEQKPSRTDCGLPETGFVFCCFNATYKINPTVFDAWSRILLAVPDSTMWLLAYDAVSEKNIRREAQARGLSADTLVFAQRVPYPDHLARIDLADLFLDTWPYNAGATANDALWVGLPVLTLSGRSFASRMGGSMLRAAGLPELVTDKVADYEARAISLATDRQLLASLRQRLNDGRLTNSLFDTDRIRAHIEAAYSRMWEQYCAGCPPAAIDVRS